MNYGEELAYWYLRLNGFFPLSNFVVHRSKGVQYTSDIDVFAIRPRHVYEDIGGQEADWDTALLSAARLEICLCNYFIEEKLTGNGSKYIVGALTTSQG